MNEDVAGTLAAGLGADYATCAECGQVFPRRSARPVTTGTSDSLRSDFTELCSDCERLNSQGEKTVLDDEP